MKRFLTSIGIKNIDDYDLDFDLVSRNNINHDQVDMLIVKNTPWDEQLLFDFLDALENIKYKYSMKFSYFQKPTGEDAKKLFESWYRSHYRIKPNLSLKANNKNLVFVFKNDLEKADNETTLTDYNDFLSFIGYESEISLSFEIKENEIEEEVEVEVEDDHEEEISEEQKQAEHEIIESLKAEIAQLKENANKPKKPYNPYRKDSYRLSLPYNVIDDLFTINPNSGNVDITGDVFGIDKIKTSRDGKAFLMFGVGRDYKTAISVKLIEHDAIDADKIASLKNGMRIHILGYASLDKFSGQTFVRVDDFDIVPPPPLRDDNEEEKRVELHLHSKMSNMDGVSTISQYCELASHMGHKAIAITDHGVVQAFPEAQKASKKYNIKMLYGSELYMVNDDLPFALNPKDVELNSARYVVFDLETTGLSSRYDAITEFGAVMIEHGREVKSLDILINPERFIPLAIQEKTHITNEMVKNSPTIKEAMPQILEFFKDAIIVSHNINFDLGFINENLERLGMPHLTNPAIDTLSLSRYMFPEARNHTLGSLSRNLGLEIYDEESAHRADYDARILNEVWQAMLTRLTEENYHLLHTDLAKLKVSVTMYKHLRPNHVVVLAKNQKGLHDLYELISESHITYLADVPRVPKSLLGLKRENILIGSACLNGEVFDVARTRSESILKQYISFYDYIEVQPPENYTCLIDRGNVSSLDEIKKYLKDIINAALEMGKIVVATGDVHYLNRENKISREVYISAKGVGGRPHPLANKSNNPSPDQHFRSTREMLDCFAFLGDELARKIVIENTNLIADMIEPIIPIDDILRQPVIEGSPEMLRNITEEKAKEYYGDPLPDFIKDRLEKELSGIIGNGYSVTYYIARRIVLEANSKGFMVGSRGSVGSSFAAFLFGITEVNPLPPHYRCPKCKHLEFIKDPNCLSGYDLDDKKCPICGEELIKDGQNIPFETFLGFNGDKVPDIDLNFPSDYQSKAFDYTKVVFGEHNVFRAGTIETVASKTAFGFVRGYFERHGQNPNEISHQLIAYIADSCVDVKRTTGQHPGGIVVLPKGMSIYDFTPIQYPADDKTSTWYTTHLDYNALHETLLKLDLLGHVDPMALRLMSELTNVDVKKIPLNDKKVISLFSTDKALNRNGNYLKVITGALALPEFGTETGNDILLDAKPKSFADLVIIAGLAHGTDVWAHNAQELIRNGTCTIREVIGCRDDIMTYLIKMGLPNNIAFKIMEDVRKGKKLKPEYEVIMREHNIPEWYLDSCNKIKYMFPKAHAVAYVTMAVRVGYFKVYYPLEFYAVWFSVRCKAYEIETLLGGLDKVIERYEEIKRKKNNRVDKISPKEKDLFNMFKVAIEMFERGYKFLNVDLEKSDALNFVVDHENKALIPPFIVLDGLGDNAALSVVEARKNGPFTSKEELLERTKLNNTNVEDLSRLGVLKNLRDSKQISLFDFGLEDI